MKILGSITGGQILIVAGGALLLSGLAVMLPERLERSDAYAQASANSEQVERGELGDVLACALIDARTSKLDGPSARADFARLGRLFGARYVHVLSSCDDRMDTFVSSVGALALPSSLGTHQVELLAAANAFQNATERYREHLQGLDGAYDAEVASPMLDALGHAVSGYQLAQRKLGRALGQVQ
ncbi:MAG: hypothetical protein OEZ06_16795 [Myxococcales bacterium]|nr:hypothetical protein [Myxococcales bacterium]